MPQQLQGLVHPYTLHKRNAAVSSKIPIREIPASYYIVFSHPPFDFLKDNGEVKGKIENLAWNYNIEEYCSRKWLWNEQDCQCYQRHYPEGIGYEVLRPVKMK